jgi:HD-GYP domain-containing protein (c-di-GMP phosphodiesterase class II)
MSDTTPQVTAALAAMSAGDAFSVNNADELPKHYGEAFIVAFVRMLKGAIFYDRNNPTLVRLVMEALRTITGILNHVDRLVIKTVRDAVFCNNQRVRISAETFQSYKGYIQQMHLCGIRELEFMRDVSAHDLTEFMFLLLEVPENREDNYEYVLEEIANRDICGVHIRKQGKIEGEPDLDDPDVLRHQSKEVYFSTIGVIKQLMGNEEMKVLDVRKAKRLMLNTVDIVLRDESTLLGLANIKSYDDYTFNHSVNVSIYAIALGQRLGLPKKYLGYLGIAALFHDVGKTNIPKEILNKPGALTPDEWDVIETHPLRGTEMMIKLKGWGELSSRIMAGTFEHHLKFNLSGYPRVAVPRQMSLFSRIIAIADCYDALGRPRVYRRVPYISEKIIGLMLQRRGVDFDPLLVKVFVNMVGVFPVGSMVLLNTNELGVVVKIPGEAAHLLRPHIQLLQYANGELQKGDIIDLTEVDEATGRYKRSIMETLNPNNYNFRVDEFFI